MDLRLQSPFTCMVVGPSGSGKSYLVRRVLEHRDIVMRSPPARIVWCYGVWQGLYDQLQTALPIEFVSGLPSDDLLREGNFILVIDDLMHQAQSSDRVAKIFTKYSHHNNITCFLLTQNLFPKGSEVRNISLNSNYIVLMKNSRDRAQIQHLARQVYPGQSRFLVDAYADATRNPFGYLLLDFCNDTNDALRVRTGIVPGEEMYCYKPKL